MALHFQLNKIGNPNERNKKGLGTTNRDVIHGGEVSCSVVVYMGFHGNMGRLIYSEYVLRNDGVDELNVDHDLQMAEDGDNDIYKE